MSERWKPTRGEKYWAISFDNIWESVWQDHAVDNDRWLNCQCFKTQKGAKLAAEKIKALLLSLHATQDKALPKLTAEVFERPDCPEWAKYAAVDADGDGFYYEDKPRTCETDGEWLVDKCIVGTNRIITGDFDPTDWQNSLIERPAVLPDWCKVGEWVYLSNAKYYKIERIRFDGGLELSDGVFLANRDIHAEAVSARLRPYNADEMKALVGAKVMNNEGNIYLCTAFIKENHTCNAAVDIDSWVTAGGLLEYGYVIDGKPCGKLEHLENGEWVE